MLEGERSLWLRGAVLMVLAPGVVTLLAYIAVPWLAPELAERARTESALGIGFGTAALFGGVLVWGVVRGQELAGRERAFLYIHAASRVSLGLGCLMFAIGLTKPGGVLGFAGAALFVGGLVVSMANALLRLGQRRSRS